MEMKKVPDGPSGPKWTGMAAFFGLMFFGPMAKIGYNFLLHFKNPALYFLSYFFLAYCYTIQYFILNGTCKEHFGALRPIIY